LGLSCGASAIIRRDRSVREAQHFRASLDRGALNDLSSAFLTLDDLVRAREADSIAMEFAYSKDSTKL
jgi:hypothetical protein